MRDMTLDLTEEQLKAYRRFIRARDLVKLVKTNDNIRNPYIPHRDYIDSIRFEGCNHSVFIQNDEWLEYKEASSAWWKIEPRFRHDQRMRASRGDYGVEDNWDEDGSDVVDIYQYFKEE
jgi:hypothetical protein